MHDDFDILSKTWAEQKVDHDLNLAKMKRRLLIRKASLLMVTGLELLIFLALVIGIAVSPYYKIDEISIAWMVVVLIIVLIFIPVLLKSRFRSYQLMNYSTDEWMKHEVEHSEQVVYRCKLTNYFLLIFSIALYVFLILMYLVEHQPLELISIRFVVSSLVFLVAYFFNRKIRSSHVNFLNNNQLN